MSRIKSYCKLCKPSIVLLVIFSGFTGIAMNPEFRNTTTSSFLIPMIAMCIGASSAGAFNMWYDRDIDAIMERTKERPIPSGKITPRATLTFSIVIGIFSILLMHISSNFLSAMLLASSILSYAIYTIYLKRNTVQNIVIGGAAGAFPPMIGWSVISNDITTESMALFMIIFFWTPPHFWPLSILKMKDYKDANVPMMPVICGIDSTVNHIIVYTIILFALTLMPFFIGMSGYLYLFCSIILGGIFLRNAIDIKMKKNSDIESACGKTFGFSILYLFALLGAMMTDKAIS